MTIVFYGVIIYGGLVYCIFYDGLVYGIFYGALRYGLFYGDKNEINKGINVKIK